MVLLARHTATTSSFGIFESLQPVNLHVLLRRPTESPVRNTQDERPLFLTLTLMLDHCILQPPILCTGHHYTLQTNPNAFTTGSCWAVHTIAERQSTSDQTARSLRDRIAQIHGSLRTFVLSGVDQLSCMPPDTQCSMCTEAVRRDQNAFYTFYNNCLAAVRQRDLHELLFILVGYQTRGHIQEPLQDPTTDPPPCDLSLPNLLSMTKMQNRLLAHVHGRGSTTRVRAPIPAGPSPAPCQATEPTQQSSPPTLTE
ncbi:hypothetical protein BU25DRAFT_420911 [Macroventuria anomochaeta]|uniref:Uncharacterized protein n=1 Tax=Macroventuria anomochaeta TaxID=301207 RepID=A0ACB6S2H4_9PLEO|nr:uncharacterized protein BU25DRAFT_420911 [Macroventuria anomochaeta]KAF2628440.1 hypothetical protein BU25DRAFT_420911 [Macroventuria anomochaeta]